MLTWDEEVKPPSQKTFNSGPSGGHSTSLPPFSFAPPQALHQMHQSPLLERLRLPS